ncbi:isopentenyl-diphosphate Delta-isomerase [Cellulomonas sp.]|uniref:isopentenyl-diphosphate Delta-isomerase n=1 Tax=Cellulomonas sp. TaxID=40001 RepID=UPI001B0361F5|nr:isopentenyl-diphosphate Delta-isomerase [Cellulomonas sp.]MBO9555669.1 isopentenyl-diphosphate Delta-isomerase [Cellulomonas sp.]
MTTTAHDDLVVLLDEHGHPCGTAPRPTVHTTATPLHLAFSCYLFSPAGRLLVTRRALTKATWPGVWTNSFCGHPRPGEHMTDAIARHARRELGIAVDGLEELLPDFRYRATDAGGVVENEICPVWFATTDEQVTPSPDEVAEVRWVETVDLGRAVAATPWAFSPWMVEQVRRLAEIGTPGTLARAS